MLGDWSMPDLALLALLQHDGAATPLLDVTTDPMVALHFACEQTSDADKDGVVLAIDVRPLRAKPFPVGETEDWSQVLAEVTSGVLGVYTPPMVTPRIMAQRSRFIFGGLTSELPYATLPMSGHVDWTKQRLGSLFQPKGGGRPTIPPIIGIRVPQEDKARIREVIDMTYGLNSETLFPDVHGFARAHATWARPLT
jgi:hypothetical protein